MCGPCGSELSGALNQVLHVMQTRSRFPAVFLFFSLPHSVIGCISLVTGGKRFMKPEINEGAGIHWILNLRIDFSRAIDIG